MENAKKEKSNISFKIRILVSSALFAALICLTTASFLHIPMVNGGFIHVGDTFIYLAAVLLPTPYAAFAAAIGAGFADILSGAAHWVWATIIIKPILVLFFTNKSEKIINTRNIVSGIIAGIVGTVLYMIADGVMMGNILASFIMTLLGLVQPVGSFILFVIIGGVFDKIKIKEIIKNK